jgi:alpha-L-rhamnosidase
MQTAYKILVTSSPAMQNPGFADLWDSGKTYSDQSILVEYKGENLNSRQRVY